MTQTANSIKELGLWNVYARMDPYDPILELWELMKERTPEQSISHKKLPSLADHVAFVQSRPYPEWYLIHSQTDGIVGSIYLTDRNEIGVFIFKAHQGKGWATAAIRAIQQTHPGERLLANINPANHRSIRTFEALGARHIQNTYELPLCEKK